MWKFLLLGALLVVFIVDWQASTSKSNERPNPGGGRNTGSYPKVSNLKMDKDGYYNIMLQISNIPDPLHMDDNDFSMKNLPSHYKFSGWMNVSSGSIKGISKMYNLIRMRPGPKQWNIELAFGSPFIEIDGMYEALIFYHTKTDEKIIERSEMMLQQPNLHEFLSEVVDRNIMVKIFEGFTVNGKGKLGLSFKNVHFHASATIPLKGKAKLLSLETHHHFDSMDLDMQNGFLNHKYSINELWKLWRAFRTPQENNNKNELWEAFETEFAACVLKSFNKDYEDCTVDEVLTFVFNGLKPPLDCAKCGQCMQM